MADITVNIALGEDGLLRFQFIRSGQVLVAVSLIHADSLESFGGAMADSDRGAPGPACEGSIDALHTVDEEDGKSESDSCSICLEMLYEKNGAVVKELPCKHRYHAVCLENWLKISATCPLCRHKLPQE